MAHLKLHLKSRLLKRFYWTHEVNGTCGRIADESCDKRHSFVGSCGFWGCGRH